MILEYSCENHKSIKEKVMFSMLASKDSTFDSLLIPHNGMLVNKVASIYGANGSGKTSFIESLGFLQTLVCNSNNHQPGDKIRQERHKLCDAETPTVYQIQFVKEDIRYAYGVSYTMEQIVSEYLYYFPNGKQAKIFDRSMNDINFGEKFKKEFESILSFSKPNKLFLSVAANYSAVKEAERVFLFFKEDLVFYPLPVEQNNWLEYSIGALNSDKELKNTFIKIMNSIGCQMVDINTKYERSAITPEMIESLGGKVPDAFIDMISQVKEATSFEAKIDYGIFSVDLNDESMGIKKLFEVLCPIIDIILKNKILIWDEMETSLHPHIVSKILDLVLHGKKDSNAQLIFTTHDTNLLDLSRFRRDQIWFTELTPSRSTDLYSLAELKNVRKDENISKGYLSGKYGAIPFVQSSSIFLNKEV